MRLFPRNVPDGVTDKMFDDYERMRFEDDNSDNDEDDFDDFNDNSVDDDEMLNWVN